MDTDDLLTQLYDKGIHDGAQDFSPELKNLWYFNDFTIYYANGSAGGFLYNKSPSQAGENHYLPYIQSWKFFAYTEAAQELEKYQLKYTAALYAWEATGKKNFELFLETAGIIREQNKILSLIKDVFKDQKPVWDWAEKHKNQILAELNKES